MDGVIVKTVTAILLISFVLSIGILVAIIIVGEDHLELGISSNMLAPWISFNGFLAVLMVTYLRTKKKQSGS